jgi:trehalose 6-phosphate synthase
MSHDLVVVANRLPIHATTPEGPWQASPGGLVRAVLPTLQAGGAWVGWGGFTGDPAPITEHAGVPLVPIGLSDAEYSGFYEGFSNSTLWPLYHDAVRPATFDAEWWKTYVTVNERFADAAAEIAGPRAAIWVHDYHLQLVPAMLRERRPDLRIGYFLHIPFPPRELFQRLPWRAELLHGMLGADVIGLQRASGAENFAAAARQWGGATGDEPNLVYEGRRVLVEAHPISIDVEEIERMAVDPAIQLDAQVLRRRLGRPKVVLLGVDRLDYTKGIDARLRAFGSLLEEGRLPRGQSVLVQVAVPTRGGRGQYGEVRNEVERLVGELNGRFGSLGAPAVHYLHQNLTLEELVPCYLAADVMLVTPFGDGMNLVAKEFVAARVDGGGRLVLSEFAGAADELPQAVPANPWDDCSLADAIMAAVEMPEAEARARMASARAGLATRDVNRWAERFLARLTVAPLARVS